MSEPGLLGEIDGRGVATLTLNRPDKGNCYDRAMLGALAAELSRLAGDAAVRLVVLRGRGRHFCAGANIGEAGSGSKAGPGIVDVCVVLDALPKPTLALVHGACIGGGLALAACCDIVIAETNAFFSLPEVRLGFAPGPLMPFLLRALGYRSLRRYLLSGQRFDGAEALRIGLVHQLAPAGALEQALTDQVEEVLKAGPNAAADAKKILQRLAGAPITPSQLAELQAAFEKSMGSSEAIEGRASFREKRKPTWS